MHEADQHDVIRIRGARTNNLRSVDLDLPKRRFIVFTGVSGSGKSSLVFDTIAAESQRLINETYSTFLQGFMPNLPRPDVDVLDGLTPAIIVDQARIGADIRSTVGTITDADAMLRILFSRLGAPHIGSPQAFSFNVPTVRAAGGVTVERGNRTETKKAVFEQLGGMCPTCEGRGTVSGFDLTQIFDADKSINEGALLIPNYSVDGWYGRIFRGCGFFDPDKPIRDFNKKEMHALLYKDPERIKVEGVNVTYEGLIPRIEKSFLAKDIETLQPHIRAFVERAVTSSTCPDCSGTRLSTEARSSLIAGVSIADVSAMQISDLEQWLSAVKAPGLAPLIAKLQHMLTSFVDVGLGYLSLNRASGTLSGGEAQRVKMIRHLGSALTDITYVFDEPTAGLHPHDVHRMNSLLLQLRDKGNTVLVVEHKPSVMAIADHLVDLGPGAGDDGGTITYAGDFAGLRASDTTTGKYLDQRIGLSGHKRTPTGSIEIRGANLHNLQNIDLDIPTGLLVGITGVAGSGKSSLVETALAKRDGVMLIDQAPIRGSRRSNPATYSGLLDPIRTAFAKANGVKASLFSANSAGACPNCNGLGVVYTNLGFMATAAAPCEVCEGKRFRPDVLEYKLHDLAINEVLDLSVEQATAIFTTGNASRILKLLGDVGLGYITIGQPLTTLSGGERQRLKLAASLRGEDAAVYVLDEPTAGLHLADTERLLHMLHLLVDRGKSVIVVEHNLAVIAQADWVIDLGPGAGTEGGRIVFEGSPQAMAQRADTLTGQYLAEWLAPAGG